MNDASESGGAGGGDATPLRADLRRVAARQDTRDPPTRAEYDAHGEYSVTTVNRRLGSWGEALVAAGLGGPRAADEAVGDATLCEDLERVAAREDTRDPPTRADYNAHGEWTAATVAKHLGGDDHSWVAALDAAGLDGDPARAPDGDVRPPHHRGRERPDTPGDTRDAAGGGGWASALFGATATDGDGVWVRAARRLAATSVGETRVAPGTGTGECVECGADGATPRTRYYGVAGLVATTEDVTRCEDCRADADAADGDADGGADDDGADDDHRDDDSDTAAVETAHSGRS